MATYSSNTTRKITALPNSSVVCPSNGDVDWFTVPANTEYAINMILLEVLGAIVSTTGVSLYIRKNSVQYPITANLIGGVSSSTASPPYNQSGNSTFAQCRLSFPNGLSLTAGDILGFTTTGVGFTSKMAAFGSGTINTP